MKCRTILERIGTVLALAAVLCAAPAAAETLVQASDDDPVTTNQTAVVDEMVNVFSYWNVVDRRFVLAGVIARSGEALQESIGADLTDFSSESSSLQSDDDSALQSTQSEISLMSCEDDCGDQYVDCRYDCLGEGCNFEICLDDCEEEYETCLMFC